MATLRVLTFFLQSFLLVKIEATVRSSSGFSSPLNFGYSTQLQNNSDSGFGFVPSRDFYSNLQYPIPNPTPFPGFHVPPTTFTPPLYEQGQFYTGQGQGPGPGSRIYERPQHFHQTGFPSTVSLPLGYFPTHFGGTTTTIPFPGSNPYSLPVPSTPPPSSPLQLQLTPPTRPHHHYPPEYYYHHGYFPPPHLPVPPRFQEGFDVGFLPTQVRVPGTIKVNIIGKDAEIICEFPKYLILVQGIYWHQKYKHDPFGSYFDTQNGFGGHTTVRSVDKWKSLLLIQDFNADNHGVYRCISTAVLPAESDITPQSSVPPPTRASDGHYNYYPLKPMLTVPTPGPFDLKPMDANVKLPEPSSNITPDGEDKKRVSRYTKNSRKMRFPATLQETNIRVKRQQPISSTEIASSKESESQKNRRFFNVFPSFSYRYSESPVSYNRLTNPYVDFFHHKNLEKKIQQERHLPFPWGYPGFGGEFFPPEPIPIPFPKPIPPSIPTTGFGLNIPYYKPEYSYTTIYQEINFEPGGEAGAQGNRWRRI